MGRNALRSAAPGQKAWLREHVLGMAIAGREGGRSRPVKKTDKATPNRLLSSQRKLRYWTQSQVAEQLGTTTGDQWSGRHRQDTDSRGVRLSLRQPLLGHLVGQG